MYSKYKRHTSRVIEVMLSGKNPPEKKLMKELLNLLDLSVHASQVNEVDTQW